MIVHEMHIVVRVVPFLQITIIIFKAISFIISRPSSQRPARIPEHEISEKFS